MSAPSRVGVLGGGRMGAGIAHAFLLAGAEVVVVERDETEADAAAERVRDSVVRAIERGTTTRTLAQCEAAFSTATDAAAFVDCELVVEAVPEDRALKTEALARAERAMPSAAVLATNTSSISIDDLAATLARPERFLGLHFFNPVPVSTLVEVVTGAATAPEVVGAARAWIDAIGKTAIVVRDSPGFASSRLGLALGLEAIRMLEEGVASAEDIDAAMTLGYRHPVRSAAHHRHRRTRRPARNRRRAAGEPRRTIRTARAAAAHGGRRQARPQERRGLLRMGERPMIDILPSYVQGAWWTPAAGSVAAEVRDASTGEPVARVSTDGLDLGGALQYARTVGQRSLGALTFHQRAMLLKQFALALTERKDELYAISARTGATKADSWVDIDGGIGVLFSYSGKGRREMPNAHVYVDGPVEPLSKDGSFLGRHIYTRLPGVAVQINAFNFPVWGSLEKFAPAFLAGMPTLVKPATPTGYLAEAYVRILVESGLLPEGSLQIVSGSVPTLFDHLRLGDLVGFTGSASTAETLRAHDCVQTGGVRFTSETDSINASILGADATEGTPEFDAFVRQLVTEMTSKAGQKCTAIRRALVPAASVDALVGSRARRASTSA